MITQTTEQQKCTLRHLTRFSSADCLAAAAKTGLAHRYLHSQQFQRQFQRPRGSLAPSLPRAIIPRTPWSLPRTPCSMPRTPYPVPFLCLGCSILFPVPFFPCFLVYAIASSPQLLPRPNLPLAVLINTNSYGFNSDVDAFSTLSLIRFLLNYSFSRLWFVMPYYKVLNYAVSFFLLFFTKKRNLIEI